MNNAIIHSLEKFVTPDLVKNLIYSVDNKWILFEKYSIEKQQEVYKVLRYRDEKQCSFGKLRNAAAWIILDKYNKFFEANRVLELDLKLSSILVDKFIHNKMLKKGDFENFLLYSTKIQDDVLRHKKFQNELDKYITMAQNCQQKGFENELTRTARTQKD